MGSGAESLITEYGIGWPSPNNTGPMTDNSLTLDDDAPVQRLKGSNVIRVQSSERGDLGAVPFAAGSTLQGTGPFSTPTVPVPAPLYSARVGSEARQNQSIQHGLTCAVGWTRRTASKVEASRVALGLEML